MPTNIWEDLKLRYHQGNAVIKLIMVNVAVHISMLLVSVVCFLVVGSDTDFGISFPNGFTSLLNCEKSHCVFGQSLATCFCMLIFFTF